MGKQKVPRLIIRNSMVIQLQLYNSFQGKHSINILQIPSIKTLIYLNFYILPSSSYNCFHLCKICNIVDKEWSQWSEWSGRSQSYRPDPSNSRNCTEECGGGEQFRKRYCYSVNNTCEGLDFESQPCNTQACPRNKNYLEHLFFFAANLT